MRRWSDLRRNRCLVRIVVLLMGLAVIAPGCGQDDRAMPELDLAALEAETELGTVQAQRVDDSYTARLGEHRAISVAYLQDLGVEASADQIAVQLYDGTGEAVMIGEVDPQGAGDAEQRRSERLRFQRRAHHRR